jgi:dTDP-4-amino-4,6-dideoxygalactose transaminase
MKYKIPFIKPAFPSAAEVSEDFSTIVAANWYTNFGPYEQKFRSEVAAYLAEGSHVVTAANATLGIELAVLALMYPIVEQRKEVLVQSFTFAAGPEVLIRHGFTPVFIDIDEATWQADVKRATAYIDANKEKVAGILFCNTFGVGNPEIAQWEEMAKAHGLPLIIDSAAGFGSKYSNDEKVGLRGDCEVFSLHATKPFCIGEGGLVIARDAGLAEKIRRLENFGFDSHHDVAEIGTNAKLQELNCAIGLRQLALLDERLSMRHANLAQLKEMLGEAFIFQTNDAISSIPFASVLMPSAEARARVLGALEEQGIEAKTYYVPLHNEPVLMGRCKVADNLRVTEEIASRIVSLPVYSEMPESELGLIADTLKSVIA